MGPKKESEAGLGCNATSKFAVLDAPGIKQPVVEDDAAGQAKGGKQGRRAKASTGPKIDETGLRIGGDSFVKRTKDPEWLKQRVAVYEKIAARRAEELGKKKPVDITVTLPDGKVLTQTKAGENFQAWKTSPYDVACAVSQGLADASTVARVTYESFVEDYSPAEDGMEGEDTLMDAMADGGVEQGAADNKVMLWDMMRPLVGPVAKLELLKFADDTDAKTVFWHSSAHMMGEALEHLYGCKLTIGSPLAGGFYYDSYMGSDVFKEDDCKSDLPLIFVCWRIQLIIIFLLQTNRSRRKLIKSSSRNRSSSAWLSPRKKAWSCSLTTLSSKRFSTPRLPMAVVRRCTNAAILLICAVDLTCRTLERLRPLPPRITRPPTGSATLTMIPFSVCMVSVSSTRSS